MNSVDDIFKQFGGTGAVARALEVKPSAASEMRRRSSIPVRYWHRLIEAAENKHLPLDSEALIRLHAVDGERASV